MSPQTHLQRHALLLEVRGQLQASATAIEDYLGDTEDLEDGRLPSFMLAATVHKVSLIPVQNGAFLAVLLHIIRAADQLIGERLTPHL